MSKFRVEVTQSFTVTRRVVVEVEAEDRMQAQLLAGDGEFTLPADSDPSWQQRSRTLTAQREFCLGPV